MLYLDFAASTPIRESALKILELSLRQDFANSFSSHLLGRAASKKIENCREFFLRSVKGEDFNFIFTSSASESNNTAIKGLEFGRGDKVFLCSGDHPSLVIPGLGLAEAGVGVEKIPLNVDSTIDKDKFVSLLDESVRLVLLTKINSQSGVVNNCEALARAIKSTFSKIHIHLDASQSFGKIPLSLQENYFDSVSVSAHKIGGPKGIAGLFLKKGIAIRPLIEGGKQELGIRSSSLSTPLIISFYQAYVECLDGQPRKFQTVMENWNFLKAELKKKIPAVFFPFGDEKVSGPYIMVFGIPKVSSDIIVRHLETLGIYISSSSACSSKIRGENPVYSALGLAKEYNKNILRVSFDERIGREDISNFVLKLEKIYSDMRHLI